MKIDESTVDRIAGLSKLEFDAESKKAIQEDLNKILDFVEKLNELDTENVEPLVYMTDELNVLREDEAVETISQKDALKNAPKSDSYYFKVPKVLDKGESQE